MASDKETFFRELDSLDNVTNDEDDTDDQFSRILKSSRKCREPRRGSSTTISRAIPPRLPRIQSAPEASVATCVEGIVPDTASGNRGRPKEMTRLLQSSSSEAPKNRAKKRRAESFKLVPEPQQIFKGLKFFFVPNNDVALARRLRIIKAQEYGALWARVWSSDVTHIIADKNLVFQDVLQVVEADKISVTPLKQEVRTVC
jgi:DNA polymerase IV